MTFGDFVKQERKRLKLTQRALAERSGVTKELVSLYERGKATNPRTATLRAFADVFGQPIGALVELVVGDASKSAAA